MKRILFSAMLLASMSTQAQDTYLNYTLTQGADLYGTARYVGMGGATGALGAEISGISLNPAGIGMFRRSDVALTAGFIRQNDGCTGTTSPVHGSFDQIGAVISFKLGNSEMKYVNFALNYQKKADFHHTYFADQPHTNGLSLSYQMADIANNPNYGAYYDQATKGYHMPSALSQALYDAGVIVMDPNTNVWTGQSTNTGTGDCIGNQFQSVSEGGVHSFDFNLSGNHEDRVYWGLTLGVDYLTYTNRCYYTEFSGTDQQPFDFDADSWKKITGVGANVKLGFIARPIEESPLRVGFTIETPTFYSLRMDSQLDVTSHTDAKEPDMWFKEKATYPIDSYLDYNVHSPWRFRVSLGYTLGQWIAVGADYEFALYNRTKMSYGGWDEDYFSGDKDEAMNSFTSEMLKGVHGVRVGAEAKAGKHLSFRVGYNYYSQAFKDGAYLIHDVSMPSMDVATTAHYMNLGDVNIVTLGLGYKAKKFYLDLAYKYRAQNGQFYAHDDCYNDGTGRLIHLSPVNVNLDRHQMFFTMGYKF